MAAAMARKLLSPSSASRLLLSRHLPSPTSSILHGARAPAAMDLLRIGGARGMARRPGGDGYSPARSGGGGDRAPTEMAPLFPGCDYEHWLIVMDKPGGEGASKQQMIDCYIHTLAKVLGSEEEARKKIYNVSCERHFGFGCEIDETSNKLEDKSHGSTCGASYVAGTEGVEKFLHEAAELSLFRLATLDVINRADYQEACVGEHVLSLRTTNFQPVEKDDFVIVDASSNKT